MVPQFRLYTEQNRIVPGMELFLQGSDILANDVNLNPHSPVKLWVIGSISGHFSIALGAVWADCEQTVLDYFVDLHPKGETILIEESQIDENEEYMRAGKSSAPIHPDIWMAKVEFDIKRDAVLMLAFAYAEGAQLDTLNEAEHFLRYFPRAV